MDFENKHIEKFIADSFSFRRDEKFHSLEIAGQYRKQLSLAASGRQPGKSNLQRITVLANDDESILLRVFQHRPTTDYWLFLLGNDQYNFDGALLSTSESLRYFLVRDDQEIHIPAAAEVNPVEAPLFLTFPDDRAELSIPELRTSTHTSIEFSQGQKMQVEFEYSSENAAGEPMASLVFTNTGGPGQPGKILIDAPSFSRMAPLYNDRATIRSPQEKIGDSVQLFLYE